MSDPEPNDPLTLDAFLKEHPDVGRIDVMIVDMNGLLRGKWVPSGKASKIESSEVRLPLSTSALDMWGHDVDGSGLGIISGDRDGRLAPVLSSLSAVPWSKSGTAQILAMMTDMEGAPSPYDPRQRLEEVVGRYRAAGLTPVVACELEFFLMEDGDYPAPVSKGSHLYDMDQMALFEPVLEDIRTACRVQGILADVVTAESGLGQFEINFEHQADALIAADWAVLFRRLVANVARSHGFKATFMAKPYGDDAGSGLHIHSSILSEGGQNLFAGAKGWERLSHAIGGMLASMAELQLIFTPNLNSYRRLSREGFAPTKANWGHDHRAASIRVPEKSGPGARFEHRVCGADVNPYLAIAAVLGGALRGIADQIDPGVSMDQDPESSFGDLTWDWQSAVHRFQRSEAAGDIFGTDFARIYALLKQDEIRQLNRRVTDVEYETYLGRV